MRTVIQVRFRNLPENLKPDWIEVVGFAPQEITQATVDTLNERDTNFEYRLADVDTEPLEALMQAPQPMNIIRLIKTIREAGRDTGVVMNVKQAKDIADAIRRTHGGQVVPAMPVTSRYDYNRGYAAGLAAASEIFERNS